MSVLNIQDEIEELKKKLGNMNNQPLVLENPDESDEETVSDPETEKVSEKETDQTVERVMPDQTPKIRTDSEPTEQPINSPSGQYNKYSPKNKVSFEKDDDVSDDDEEEKDDHKKILKDIFQKTLENLRVFEELTNRTIREHKNLELFPDEIEFIEDQYESELELFENTMKILRNKLPEGLDFTEQQYAQLERRINLVEKRFDKFISSF